MEEVEIIRYADDKIWGVEITPELKEKIENSKNKAIKALHKFSDEMKQITDNIN